MRLFALTCPKTSVCSPLVFTGDAFVDIVKLRYAQPAFASHMSRRGFGIHEPFSA